MLTAIVLAKSQMDVIVEKMIDPTHPVVQSWTLLFSHTDMMDW